MRRALTPCAITPDRKYLPLNRVDFTDRRIAETFLQEALNQNPAILPIDEIDTAFGPITSTGREFGAIANGPARGVGRPGLRAAQLLWRLGGGTRAASSSAG